MSKIDQFKEKYQRLINLSSIFLVPKYVGFDKLDDYTNRVRPYSDGKLNIFEKEENERDDIFKMEVGLADGRVKCDQAEPRAIFSEFLLFVVVFDSVEKLQVMQGGKWQDVTKCVDSSRRGAKVYEIPVDFNNRIEKLKYVLKFNLIEDAVLDFCYTPVDRELYAKKQQEYDMGKLVKAINASCKTGMDLVNIIFRYATEEVELVKISLFDDKRNILAKYTVPQDMFFYAIKDLAFGSYYYQIHQYNKSGKLIVESAQTNFIIRLLDSFPAIVVS